MAESLPGVTAFWEGRGEMLPTLFLDNKTQRSGPQPLAPGLALCPLNSAGHFTLLIFGIFLRLRKANSMTPPLNETKYSFKRDLAVNIHTPLMKEFFRSNSILLLFWERCKQCENTASSDSLCYLPNQVPRESHLLTVPFHFLHAAAGRQG